MLSIATEEFVKRLAKAGEQTASVERRSVVNYHDVASVTLRYPNFNFLQDMVPTPMPLTAALERRAAREKALADDDPAIAPPEVQLLKVDSPAPQSISQNSKPRIKSRQANGKEKVNGSASANSGRRVRDSKGRWSQGSQNGDADANVGGGSVSANVATRPSSARIRNRSSRASEAQQSLSAGVNGLPRQNGTSSASYDGMPPPPPPPRLSHNANHHAPASIRSEDPWPSPHYTGPASGFLDDRRLLFNGSRGGGMTDAPGRTIYSQQRPPNR